jgi:hypothetical protein
MNTLSPSALPSPWGAIVYFLMAGYALYAATIWTKQGFFDWTFRLGDRNIGLKMKEGRISRKNSSYAFWSIQALVASAFSFCLTSAVFREPALWTLILSYLCTSTLLMVIQFNVATHIDQSET